MLSSSTTTLQHQQSFTDVTNSSVAYNKDTNESVLQHLIIEPFNLIYVFTNPWTEKGHAVISVSQHEEQELWDYIYHIVKSKNNRGRIEGGSYLVYALLDYVVSLLHEWFTCRLIHMLKFFIVLLLI